MADPTWDTSKENFQPLRKGRGAKALEQGAADVPRGERATKIKEERSAFWRAVAEYDGDDPLEVWVRFIKWAENTFPSGGRETEVLPLLERCTRELQEVPRYKDDARYLRVWVKYADCCKDPHDIFKFLEANDIGQRHALFYEAYAAFLEIRGAYARAHEVYDRGVMMRAQPRERLKDKLAQFQHRMMRRKQRELEEGTGGDDAEEDPGDGRERRFGTRPGGGSRRAVDAENRGGSARAGGGAAVGTSRARGMRGIASAAAAATPSGNAHGGGLEVYCDEASGPAPAPAPAPWRSLPKYKETRKENSRAATTWNGQGLQQKRSRGHDAPAPAATLEVYEDEDIAVAEEKDAPRRKNLPAGNALRRRVDAPDAREGASRGLGARPRTNAPPLGKALAKLYGRFDARDLVNAAGEEVSYEERRAERWRARRGPAVAPPPAPGPVAKTPGGGAHSAEARMDVDTEGAHPAARARGFVTSSATTAPIGVVAEPETSLEPQSRAPPEPRRDFPSGGSCDAPPPDDGSGVGPRLPGANPGTEDAQGAGLPPAAAPPPAADAAVPAGLRWTATEGGTYGADQTMTLCTKEAWGDIMSMFSGGLVNDQAKRSADACADLPAVAEEREREPPARDDLEIREDTRPLPPRALDGGDAFGGLDVREDTVAVPPLRRAAGAARTNGNGLSSRAPLAAVPLAARAPPPPAPDDGGFEMYQDTEHLDPAAVAASVGVGSQCSARADAPTETRETGEPSENGVNEFDREDAEMYAADAENAPPPGHPSLATFAPRTIAAAAAAALRPIPVPLDLRSEARDESDVAEAEEAMRSAVPPPELRGEDPFDVYEDDAETAPVPKAPRAFLPQRLTARSTASLVRRGGYVAPHPTPVSADPVAPRTGDEDEATRPPEALDPFAAAAKDARLAAAYPETETDAVRFHPGPEVVAATRAALKAVTARRARARGGVSLTLGDAAYDLMARAGVGADAEVFEAEHAAAAEYAAACSSAASASASGSDDDRGGLAVKVQSAPLAAWEWVVSRRLRARVSAWDAPGVVFPETLHLVGGRRERAATAELGVLVMPFGEHGTLQDVINSYLCVGSRMDEVLVMYYAIELLRAMEAVHAAGVLHADVKPDNLIVRNGGEDWCDWAPHRPGAWKKKGLALIDFGRAVDLAEYPADVTFVGDVMTEGFRCAEMTEGRAWTFQCDLHQIAATVHCLLHGKYMTVSRRGGGKVRPREPLKRYWRTDLWDAFFDETLNGETRRLDDPPPLGNLRRMFEAYLSAEGLGPKIRALLMQQTIDMYEQVRKAEA